jgi:hypothetical protein
VNRVRRQKENALRRQDDPGALLNVQAGGEAREDGAGMDRAHEADPDANREWYAKEWNFVLGHAPLEVLIPITSCSGTHRSRC